MRIAGLIGHPVEHSLSQAMHNAAFAALGFDARYELWDTPPENLAERVGSLRPSEMLGANITVPHKQSVIPMLDEITERARRIGAVNTIVATNGSLLGDNTDVYGFEKSLGDVADLSMVRRAVVVGAGGAARAVLVGLQEAGIDELVIVNRTVERGEALAQELSVAGKPPIVAASITALETIAPRCQVAVNATSVGWHGNELPFDEPVVDALPDDAVVMDLTYRETALLRQSAGRGLLTLDGLPMLVHQGARAFTLWTGLDAPVPVMTEAVLAEQSRRA